MFLVANNDRRGKALFNRSPRDTGQNFVPDPPERTTRNILAKADGMQHPVTGGQLSYWSTTVNAAVDAAVRLRLTRFAAQAKIAEPANALATAPRHGYRQGPPQ